MSPARRITLLFRVSALLLAASCALLFVVRMVEPLGVDQGLFACFTRWVPRGWLPYRDIFDSKPPLFLYSYALAAAFPGDIVRAVWWLEGVWLAGTLALAHAFAARLWGRWSGLATAALLFVGLWSPSSGGFWARAQAEELLTPAMLGAAWLAYRARDDVKLALWAGVLTGLCGLYKIPSMAIAAAWSIMWLGCLSKPDALRRVGLLVAGMAAPWLLTVAWFAAHGALGSFVEAVFVYPRHNAAFISPPWTNVLQDFTVEMVMRASLQMAAAAIGIGIMAERRAGEIWLVAPWLALTMAAIVSQRQLAGYHFLLAAPALAFAGGYGMGELARGARYRLGAPRVQAYVGVALLGALGVRAGAAWWKEYAPDAARLAGRTSRDDYLRQIQRGNYSNVNEEQAARYLREHTRPDDGILVWGLSPGIYALADRHPVTRFPFHKLLMTDAPLSRMIPGLSERRARFMDGLRADPPAYILVGRGDRNGFEPEDSSSSLARFEPFRAMVEHDYHLETQIGRFLVLRRGPP